MLLFLHHLSVRQFRRFSFGQCKPALIECVKISILDQVKDGFEIQETRAIYLAFHGTN